MERVVYYNNEFEYRLIRNLVNLPGDTTVLTQSVVKPEDVADKIVYGSLPYDLAKYADCVIVPVYDEKGSYVMQAFGTKQFDYDQSTNKVQILYYACDYEYVPEVGDSYYGGKVLNRFGADCNLESFVVEY